MSLLLISGSLRDGSTNTAMLRTAQAIDPDTERFAGMGALPHFSPDDDDDDLPAAVAQPGGQPMRWPPRTCRCRWGTELRASSPTLNTSR